MPLVTRTGSFAPEFWQSAINSLSAHIAILDSSGVILAVNRAWTRFAANNGHAGPDASLGANYLAACDLASAADPDVRNVAAGIRAVIDGSRPEFAAAYPCHSPVRQRWFLVRCTPFDGPGPARAVIAHENITAAKAAQLRAVRHARDLERASLIEKCRGEILELIAANDLLETILERIAALAERLAPGSACGICSVRDKRLLLAAPGSLPPHIVESIPLLPLPAAPFSGDSLGNLAAAVRQGAEPAPLLTPICSGRRKLRGALVIDPASVIPGPGTLQQVAALAAIALDHASRYERLAFQARYDALTGLPNRLYFQEHLQQAVTRSRRARKPFALLMVDVDRFKQINDAHGHRVGDVLLRQVASRITRTLRSEDVAARLGGDEFIVILEGIESAAGAECAAARLAQAFAEPFHLLDHHLIVTCSVGMCVFPEDGIEGVDLVRNADTAMYSAKRRGRNLWERFSPEMGSAALERLEIEQHLRTALARRELYLEYQPQLDYHRRVVGVEALMRWRSPVLGHVSPARFIPIAEECGLIVNLGTWALLQACEQAVEWQRSGYAPIRMAVNVSASQLNRRDFAETVSRTLLNTGFRPELLELEITETSLMRNVEDAVRQMDQIRRLGVRISIDDFGTGYSSLSYIQNLPVDCIKIDQSFIQELAPHAHNTNSVVQAIIALAHGLKLKVVAEGVEREEQLQALSALKCDLAQGYLFHKPLPAAQLELILEPSRLPKSPAAV